LLKIVVDVSGFKPFELFARLVPGALPWANMFPRHWRCSPGALALLLMN
jgi:hypothetical protein